MKSTTTPFVRRASLPIVLAVVALVVCRLAVRATAAWAPQATGPETIEVWLGGLHRTALVYVPPSYDGTTALPLVLSFHGRHGTAADQATLTDLHGVGARNNFIVVYPEGIRRSWNAMHGAGHAEILRVDDLAYVDALLTRLGERYKIDPDRVYASGMSNGAFFGHRLGCERSGRFAAISTVAGEMAPALGESCRPERPMPMLIFHGTYDPMVLYLGGATMFGGSSLSAPKTADIWRTVNGANPIFLETFRSGQVICHSYQSGLAPVTLCTVNGAGHTWPGGYQYLPVEMVGVTNYDINASEMMWQFFAAHPRRSAASMTVAPAPPSGLRIGGN